jgi:hypothetical protein
LNPLAPSTPRILEPYFGQASALFLREEL